MQTRSRPRSPLAALASIQVALLLGPGLLTAHPMDSPLSEGNSVSGRIDETRGLAPGPGAGHATPDAPGAALETFASPREEVDTSPGKAAVSRFTAGFAARDLTWRAGAKPGQVGTDANTPEMVELWRGLVKLLLHAYRYQTTDRPVLLLEYVTQWSIDYLLDRVDEIRYDHYTDAFEPGRGLHTRASAKAIVLEKDGTKVALVKSDMYLMQKHIWRRVAELVGPETGLAPEQIMISGTHNHSAADAGATAAGIASMAESFDPRHFVWFTHTIADTIIEADAARAPASFSAIRSTLRAVQANVIGPATGEAIPPGRQNRSRSRQAIRTISSTMDSGFSSIPTRTLANVSQPTSFSGCTQRVSRRGTAC